MQASREENKRKTNLRHSGIFLTVLFLLGAFLTLDNGGFAPATSSAETRKVTKADIERWISELSNWGRWGKDDELGAINLITPEKRKQAAALVKAGVSVSLARDAETRQAADNGSPFGHKMLLTGTESPGQWCADNYSVSYHGYAHTHIDALCHIFHNGKIFNGFSRQTVASAGATKLSIRNLKNGIFTRGVLMDIPRLRELKYLEPRAPIYPEDLEAWEKRAGFKVSSGDVVLIRTGRWLRRAEVGPWDMEKEGSAGLHASCVKWLREQDIAVLGSDAASDVLPSGVDGVSHPVHLLILYSMGVHILDNCDLEALSTEAARQNRWEFLLTTAPIPVIGGTGSPLNPIATF